MIFENSLPKANFGPNIRDSTNGSLTADSRSLQTVTLNVKKVIKLLKAIDVSKATGLDKIPTRLLKIAADVVAPSLTGIFNQSLVTGIFPSDWKIAKVSRIFKNGSKSDLNNYRPISVIPTVAKTFEKIIYDQLYQYLN